MEKTLLDFFIEWLAVVEGGSDNPTGMDVTQHGLCYSVDRYCVHYDIYPMSKQLLGLLDLYTKSKQCEESTMNYPFGGKSNYRFEMQMKTVHQNEERLAFVRNYIKEYSYA